MKPISHLSAAPGAALQTARKCLLGVILPALSLGFLSLVAAPASAHEAPCPRCKQAITQDTPTQDNEVALKAGRKRIEYKCVACAVTDAQAEIKGDITILAPSEIKGNPVQLKRAGGEWSVLPQTAAFVLASPLQHRVCEGGARAYTSAAAAQAALALAPAAAPAPRVLKLAEFVAASTPAKALAKTVAAPAAATTPPACCTAPGAKAQGECAACSPSKAGASCCADKKCCAGKACSADKKCCVDMKCCADKKCCTAKEDAAKCCTAKEDAANCCSQANGAACCAAKAV